MYPKLTEFPTWINTLPAKDQGKAKVKFMLRYAAVLATPEASIPALSLRMGLHRNTLTALLCQPSIDGRLSQRVIKGIESLIGVGTIPREMMDPTVYDI